MVSKIKSFTGSDNFEQFNLFLIRCECNQGETFWEGTDPNQNVWFVVYFEVTLYGLSHYCMVFAIQMPYIPCNQNALDRLGFPELVNLENLSLESAWQVSRNSRDMEEVIWQQLIDYFF